MIWMAIGTALVIIAILAFLALNFSRVRRDVILHLAKRLPEEEGSFEEWVILLDQLPEDERASLLQYAQDLLKRQKEAEANE